MAVYLVTGKLGNGKSLIAVGKAVDYAIQGRRVVANFHIDLAPVATKRGSTLSKAAVTVIPARPSSADLLALGEGGETESKAGLLILDECGTFLNSREWQDKDRSKVIDWLLHSRKLGWDVLLIVQHQSMLDKQVRESVCEFLVVCRRLDRFNIPFISFFFPVKMPRVHVALVRYGLSMNDMKAETWVYRGDHLFACYSTKTIFKAVEQEGAYSVLPAELSKWRYIEPWSWVKIAQRFGYIGPQRPQPKQKARLVELLMKLPEPQRIKHWQRLEALGAF